MLTDTSIVAVNCYCLLGRPKLPCCLGKVDCICLLTSQVPVHSLHSHLSTQCVDTLFVIARGMSIHAIADKKHVTACNVGNLSVQKVGITHLALLNGRLARATASCVDWQPLLPIKGYHEQAQHEKLY